MELLPDDALLAVLSYVDNCSLLKCRLVCHRWRDLLAHPDAWRRRTIGSRLLHLSPPCCYKLTLEHWECNGFVAATVACPATILEIGVNYNPASVALSTLVIRHQASLGHLRVLSVRFRSLIDLNSDSYPYHLPASLKSLAEQLLNRITCQLHIVVDWHWPHTFREYFMEESSSAIHELHVRLHLPYIYCNDDFRCLSKLVNLKKFRCAFIDGLEHLIHCRALRDLDLALLPCPDTILTDFDDFVASAIASARFLLRSLTWLRRLTLRLGCHDNPIEPTRGLVLDLGDSGQSELTYLEVQIYGSYQEQIWSEIVFAVPKLHKIEDIVYHGNISLEDLRDLLLVAPALRSLYIDVVEDCICCSWAEICSLLGVHPELELSIEHIFYGKCVAQCSNVCSIKSLSKVTFRNASSAVSHGHVEIGRT
ncbi:F-box/WD repeat-containing protein pof11 [Frankliniella fusca]|uniref:F-box/WD repeat-containing protein pof11 n=1 Tax=Frankliniella fusca TaxID=407009 RepID=A0AAE1LBQ6_9NEOP|nr:F-box/WD repeat-containing protein pof11 [Frankliniella fusca]